ncbi:MAG: ABC transporter permease [Saprospiraceae bacterium]|nr:ABC transporter permease [Saprospiraceae bacterium]
MVYFIAKRLLSGFFMLLVIFFISIWMIRLIPGSYEELIMADEKQSLEYNKSSQNTLPLFYFSMLPEQEIIFNGLNVFPHFIWNGLQCSFHQKLKQYVSMDFGNSLIDQVPVKTKISKAFPWSLALQIPALFIVIILSFWVAYRSVRFPNSKWMQSIGLILVWLHSVPGFWLATLLLLLFANPDALHLFPAGMQGVASKNPFEIWIYFPNYYILPLCCLVIPSLAYLTRFIKNGLEESIQKPYWTRALSSGLSWKQALRKEALPNALIPLIVWVSGIFPALISGALIIEQIFSIPGLGRLMFQSISSRDWPVVEFLFLLGAMMTILGFLISDFLLRYFDPRIQNQ